MYINNSGLNDKNEDDLEKYISTDDGHWLDGERVEIMILGHDMLPPGAYSGELADLQEAVDATMYKLCAQLEEGGLFGLFPHSDSFCAFNVWHEEESEVDFQLRKSCREDCVQGAASGTPLNRS